MHRGLPALLLLVVAFSGCADDPAPLVTAQDARVRADIEAKGWDGNATLVGVFGLEAGRDLVQGSREEDASDDDNASAGDEEGEGGTDEGPDDYQSALEMAVDGGGGDAPGDGRARAWAFLYRAEGREEGIAVVVKARGAIETYALDDEEDFQFQNGPIQDWTIDSDEAADLAADHNETYDEQRGRPTAASLSALFMAEEDPYWLLGIEGEGNESSALVIVNARNGTVAPFDPSVFLLGLFTFQESGAEDFRLTTLQATHTTQFDVQLPRHAELAIDVHFDPAVPASAVHVVVTAPDGTVIELDAASSPGSINEESFVTTTDVPTGTYTVEVQLTDGVLQDVEFSWCTSGVPILPPIPFAPVSACQHLGS